MKKIYSIVLMAAMLLVGTSAWAGIKTADQFLAAFNASGTVTLDNDIYITASNAASWNGVWIGTENEGDPAKSITLDLAGNNIFFYAGDYKKSSVQTAQTLYPFVLSKGTLKVISSAPAGIYVLSNGNSAVAKGTNVFTVFGTYNRVDPQGANPFSHLEIGEGVTVSTQNGTVIAVDALYQSINSKKAVTYHSAVANLATKPLYRTDYYKSKYGFAFGAFVEVKGELISQGEESTKCYAIKTNGYLENPGTTNEKRVARDPNASYNELESYFVGPYSSDDIAYTPYVHVYSTAHLVSDNSYLADGSAAVYASGYARWLVEGNCEGATGLYASSGDIDIAGEAAITSTAESYVAPTDGGHANGAGSAIVINSRDGYTGQIEMEISDQVEVTSTTGYAIEEAVNTKPVTDPETQQTTQETKVENITITGGTFQGGTDPVTQQQQPAIVVTGTTADDAEVVVYGGNIVNGAEVGEAGGIEKLIDPTTSHTTEIVQEDGSKVTVISEGVSPTPSNKVSDQVADASVKWTGADYTVDHIATNKVLTELEINDTITAADKAVDPSLVIGQPREQTLYIDANVTLEVGRVVLGNGAKIIVAPGAKLIVTGNQGIVAPAIDNVSLQHNSVTGQYATFLIHPNVSSNIHPNATVAFTTDSWWVGNNAGEYQWEWFGIPTYSEAKSITSTVSAGTVYASVEVFENNSWVDLGYIGGAYDNNPAVLAKLNKPFAAYNLMAYRASDAEAPEITISGEMVGNVNAALNANMKWNTFANSYTAEVDAAALLNYFKLNSQNIDASIYLADHAGNGSLTWNTRDDENVGDLKLRPMQAFLLLNNKNVETTAIDYASMVYNAATSNQAPRRRVASSSTSKVVVNVANENGTWDDVELRENENTKVCEKYLNNDVNIYVVDGEKNDIVAVENLDGTYVGFSTVNGGNFTISFTQAEGREFDLIDMETGAKVAVMNGATYEFTAAANTVADYRFKLVERNNAPTAIDNTEAVKSAKGIYTITGQYLGEMNVWNTLPAGVYVINGEKRVK